MTVYIYTHTFDGQHYVMTVPSPQSITLSLVMPYTEFARFESISGSQYAIFDAKLVGQTGFFEYCHVTAWEHCMGWESATGTVTIVSAQYNSGQHADDRDIVDALYLSDEIVDQTWSWEDALKEADQLNLEE